MDPASPIARYRRVHDRLRRGHALAPEDAAWIEVGMRRAITHDLSLERALGLGQGWRARLVRDEIMLAIEQLIAGEQDAWIDTLAGRLHAELVIYLTGEFLDHAARDERPEGRRGWFFDLLVANGCKVPGRRTLWRRISEA